MALVAISMLLAFAPAANAKPGNANNGDGKSQGSAAVLDVTVSCDPGPVVTITSLGTGDSGPKAISNLTIVFAGGEIRIEDPFNGSNLTSWVLDAADYPGISGVYVKAGSNSKKGKGYGVFFDLDIDDSTCIPDSDDDGIDDDVDNCPNIANPNQENVWATAILGTTSPGDACVTDANQNGIADINETDICVHINGTQIIKTGTAFCLSASPAAGGAPNIATADGDNAFAAARGGDGNIATADGDNAFAAARGGDGNTATATGNNAFAAAQYGNDNTATATGTVAFALAGGTLGNPVNGQTVIVTT